MKKEITKIRRLLLVFMVFLALSGITAFPLRSEINFLYGIRSYLPAFLADWIAEIHGAVRQTPDIVLYGTDWLAFAHLVIAVNFIGAFKAPLRNRWIIQSGMIACLAVFPLAFICGPIRGIPFFHQLIDCLFGLLGILPLYICHNKIKTIEKLYPYERKP